MSQERLVLAALVQNAEFAKKVVGYVKADYFETDESKAVFGNIKSYLMDYSGVPNRLALETMVDGDKTLDDKRVEGAKTVIADCFDIIPPDNIEFLMKQAETWCKDRALYLAINKAISVYQGEDKKLTSASIPDIVKEALSVNFDVSLGMDYYDDAERRWEYYVTPENKLPFRLSALNDVTCGGVTRKSLNVVAAGVNVGKSMTLIALAADYVRLGYNVLYISLEMREEMVLQRIDANLLNTAMNEITGMGKERFMGAVQKIREKSYGRFKAKDFPPSSASAMDFDRLIDDYEMMHGFTPDIVMIDYIQITASYKMPAGTGSYYYYKSVAEELRSIAVRRDLVMWTVSQFNRGGMENTDPSMGDIAESVGIPATADGMWAVMRTNELDIIGQLAWKQLKSRYANKAVKPTFLTGVDVDRQQLFDVAEVSENSVSRSGALARPPVSTKDRFAKMKYQNQTGVSA
jgi:replicative DNA helicase